MIDGKSVLAVIIARGGSKGVPRKNVLDVGGKPLIAWSVLAAHRSAYIDRTVLSTEDAEIIEVARSFGCEAPFVRDGALATDEATGTAVLLDALERVPDHDYVVLLQATSPLRTAADIDGAIEQCVRTGAPTCVAVAPLGKPLEWLMRISDDDRLEPASDGTLPDRRQDASTIYAPNGAVFVALCSRLKETRMLFTEETVAYVMPPERSVDIDTPYDLAVARELASAQGD